MNLKITQQQNNIKPPHTQSVLTKPSGQKYNIKLQMTIKVVKCYN